MRGCFAGQTAERRVQVLAHRAPVLEELRIGERTHCGDGGRARERIPAERRAVRARVKADAKRSVVHMARSGGPAERLRERDDVGTMPACS